MNAIYALLLIPEVLYIVIVKTVVGVPAGVFHSMFTVVNMDRFELTPRTNGYLLTYIGIVTAVSLSIIIMCMQRQCSRVDLCMSQVHCNCHKELSMSNSV